MPPFSRYHPAPDPAKYEQGYRYGKGKALAVVRPQTIEEVQEILRYCHEQRIGIIPQGGNTGLVGASVPDTSGTQLLLSTELLNRELYQPDTANKTVRVGAGMVLGRLNEQLEPHGLFLPIDIGSSGTCTIGGLIATNAAGTRAGRYGNTLQQTLDITVVLASGEVQTHTTTLHHLDPALPQDNSRLDKENPFIGSGGWLGVITQATMRLEQKPVQDESVVLVPTDSRHIPAIHRNFTEQFGLQFTAFEGMSDTALQLVAKHIPNTRYLFEGDPFKTAEQDYALLVEVASCHTDDPLASRLMETLTHLMQDGLISTGLQGKTVDYWHVRHHISEAIRQEGQVIATDIAVRGAENLSDFRQRITARLRDTYPHLLCVPFGHEMLGALHFNMVWPRDVPLSPQQKKDIQAMVYECVVNEYKGTFSAEHGIGPHNQWAYDRFTPEEVKHQAAQLKNRIDPYAIMNPNVKY